MWDSLSRFFVIWCGGLVLLPGCAMLLNGEMVPPGAAGEGAATANRPVLAALPLVAGANLQSSYHAPDREISVSGLRSGNFYSFVLTQDNIPMVGLECEEPVAGQRHLLVEDSVLHVTLARSDSLDLSSGSLRLDCSNQSVGSFELVLNFEVAEISVISSNPEMMYKWDENHSAGAVSYDGRYLAWVSHVYSADGTHQLLVTDLAHHTTELISRSPTSAANNIVGFPVISGDGRWVAFVSKATNLVNGAGLQQQLFVKDRMDIDGVPFVASSVDSAQSNQSAFQADATVTSPSLSSDGRWIVFVTSATNLVTGASGSQAYLKDRLAPAQAPVLVSSRDSTQADQSTFQANNGVSTAGISGDGRWIYFLASSTNLVTGASGSQVYLKDRLNLAQAPVLVSSTDSTQANQSAYQAGANVQNPLISEDGRWISFMSIATNLVTGGGGSQIYLKDRNNLAAPPVLVSSQDSTQPDQTAYRQTGSIFDGHWISADGRWLFFSSNQSGVVTGSGGRQMYRKDRLNLASPPIMVSSLQPGAADQSGKGSDHSSSGGGMLAFTSKDGRWFFFVNEARNFSAGISGAQLYRWDLGNLNLGPVHVSRIHPTVHRRPVLSAATSSVTPAVSDDGQRVLISSGSTRFPYVMQSSSTTPGGTRLTLRDHGRLAALPTLVTSANPSAVSQQWPNYKAGTYPNLSGDGRFAVFASTSFAAGVFTNQIYRMDLDDYSFITVSSLDSSQADQTAYRGNAASDAPSVSGDGQWVVFQSTATNFVTGGTGTQIYLKNLADPAAAPVLVSSLDSTQANQSAFQANAASSNPRISSDGRWIAFESTATNLVTGGGGTQIYVKDRNNLALPPVLASSVDSTQGNQAAFRGNSTCTQVRMSADGRWLVFQTSSSNFVTNGGLNQQVYLKDMDNPQLRPVVLSSLDSTLVDQAGVIADSTSSQAAISNDGRWIVFASWATNLLPGTEQGQIWLKDRTDLASPPLLVSTRKADSPDALAGAVASASSFPAISGDGRWIYFSSGTGLVGPAAVVYRKNPLLPD